MTFADGVFLTLLVFLGIGLGYVYYQFRSLFKTVADLSALVGKNYIEFNDTFNELMTLNEKFQEELNETLEFEKQVTKRLVEAEEKPQSKPEKNEISEGAEEEEIPLDIMRIPFVDGIRVQVEGESESTPIKLFNTYGKPIKRGKAN